MGSSDDGYVVNGDRGIVPFSDRVVGSIPNGLFFLMAEINGGY